MSTNDDAMRMMIEGLAELTDMLKPLYEMAEGQRAELVSRGWTQETAEKASGELLAGMLRKATE